MMNDNDQGDSADKNPQSDLLEEIDLEDMNAEEVVNNPVSVFAARVRQRYLQGSSSLRPSSEIHNTRQWRLNSSENKGRRLESEGKPPSVYARYYREKKTDSDVGGSENAVKSFKQGKTARENFRNDRSSSGPNIAKETAILSFENVAIDDHESESEELSMEEAFDQEVDYEMEGSFVNKAEDLESDNSNHSRTILSPGLKLVASTMQSWLPAFASGMTAKISTDFPHKSKHFLGGESKLDDIINEVPIRYIENARAGILSFNNNNEENLSDQDLLMKACFKEENPRKKEKLLLKALFGPAYDDGNEIKEFNGSLDGKAGISLPGLPFLTITGKNTTLAIMDYLLELFEKKKVEIQNLDRAWWLEECKIEPPCLSYNDILQLNLDSEGEVQPGTTNEDKPGSSGLDVEEDLEDGEDIDWDELLWAKARRHWHLAYLNLEKDMDKNDNGDESVEDNSVKVTEFRSCMVTCLKVYVKTFYSQEFSGENDTKFLLVSNYVPIDVAKALFSDVVRKSILASKKRVSCETASVEGEGREIDTYASAICSALLEGRDSLFRHFDIDFVGIGKAETDIEKQRNLIKLTNPEDLSDRILVDEFLYGISRKGPADLTDGEQLPDNKANRLEIEVQMNSSLKRHIANSSNSNQNDIFYDTLISEVLLSSLKEDEAEAVGTLGGINYDDETTRVSLSTAYAFKCIIVFLLRSLSVQKRQSIESDHSEEKLHKSDVLQILVDSSFIRKRIEIFGAFLAVSGHLNDWQLLLSVENGNVIKQLYLSKYDREQYCEIHKKLASELQYSLDCVVSIEKESQDKGTRERARLAFDEEAMGQSFSTRVRNVYRFIEIGRSAYTLGLELGKNEKAFHNSDFPDESVLSAADCFQIEATNYQIATSSFREATSILVSCRQDIETANRDTLPGEQQKFSAHIVEIEELAVSVDLFLADTFVLKGFCCDVKHDEYERAVTCYREALRLYRHLGKKHTVVISAMQNLGSANFDAQNWEEALNCFNHRLSILKQIEKAQSKPHSGNKNKSMEVSRVNEEICITLQSIARSHGKMGDMKHSIKSYTDAIDGMRDILQNPSLPNSIDPLEFLDESLSELSVLQLVQARELFDEWAELSLGSMFNPLSGLNSQPITTTFHAAVEFERNAFHCLDESIQFRVGLESSTDFGEYRYNQRHVVSALESLPSNQLHEFRQSLAQNGIFKFRQRRYVQASTDLAIAFKMHLSDDTAPYAIQLNGDLDLEVAQLPDLISPEFVDDARNYKLLLFILQLGNLCIRLEDLESSFSFFSIALKMCTNRFNSPYTSQSEKLGVQLDLADIHRNLGVLHTQRGEFKVAVSHLRTASRLLDRTLSDPSEGARSEEDEFVLEAFIKLKIAVVLNYLGRVYDRLEESSEEALICLEDSMVIMEDVLDEFKQDASLFFQMNCIPKIAKGSCLQIPPSLLSLGSILGDNYFRAGKNYTRSSLLVDAELAFHRAISIYEELKDENYFLHDNENTIEYLQSDDLNEALLNASKLALALMEQNREDEMGGYDDDEGLHYGKEDLIFRIGNCLGELKRYDEALEYLQQAKKITTENIGYENFVIASICHNIGSVKRLKYFDKSDDDARYGAIFSFEEAVHIASTESISHHELFVADCMFRVVEMKMVQSIHSPSETNHLAHDEDLLNYLETALEIRLNYYGDAHSDVALTRYLLGKCYYFRGNIQKSLQTLDQALSQWQNLYSSVNLDIFDAIYFRGLCQKELLRTSQFYPRELETASRYFLDSIRHSRSFLASASVVAKDGGLDVTCLIHAIRCALELVVTSTGRDEEREFQLKSILSTIKYSMSTFTNEKTQEHIVLCDLAGNTWMRIAKLNDARGAYETSVLAHEAVVALYLSLNDGHEIDILLKRAVATFMLANRLSRTGAKKKSQELYHKTLHYIRELDGDDTFEAAATSVYIGTKDSSTVHLKRALTIYKAKAILSQGGREYTGIGQEGILLKHMAIRKFANNEFRIAFATISSAISKLERVRVSAAEVLNPPTTLEEALLLTEDWDLHLLEAYTFALHIAVSQRRERVVDVVEITRKIAILFADQVKFDQSFQCFYCLLLHLHNIRDSDDASMIATLLLDMGTIVEKAEVGMGSAPFHEEFIRITSATLGMNHIEVIPSIVCLGVEMLKIGNIEDALKWADIGLSSVQAIKLVGNEAILLALIKAEAILRHGKLSFAKMLLLKALGEVQPGHEMNARIHWLLGEAYSESHQTRDALLHYCTCLRIREEFNGLKGNIDVKQAIGKAFVSESLFGQAKACFTDALDAATRLHGCDHIEVAKCLHGLAKVYSRSEPKRAESLLIEGIRIFRLNPVSGELGSALFDMGTILEAKAEFERAKECYVEASESLKLSQGNILLQAKVHRATAFLYYRTQDLIGAKHSFQHAIFMIRKVDEENKSLLGDSFYWVGCVLYLLDEIEASQKSFRAGLNIFMKNREGFAKMVVLTKVAQARNYAKSLKRDEAVNCLKEATKGLNASKKKLTPDELVTVYALCGELYHSLQQVDIAISFTKKAINITDRQGNAEAMKSIDVHSQIIGMYLDVREYRLAKEHATIYSRLVTAKYSEKSQQIAKVQETLGDIENALDHIGPAIDHYEKALCIQGESLHTIEYCQLLSKLAIQYQANNCMEKAMKTFVKVRITATLVQDSEPLQIRATIGEASIFFKLGRKDEAVAIYLSLLDNLQQFEIKEPFSSDAYEGIDSIELVHIFVDLGSYYLSDDAKNCEWYLNCAAQLSFADGIESDTKWKGIIATLASKHQDFLDIYGQDESVRAPEANASTMKTNMGRLHIQASNFNCAVTTFLDVMKYQQNSEDKLQLSTTLHNIGSCFLEIGDIRNAILLLEDASEIGKAMLGYDNIAVADTMYTLARAYSVSSNADASIPLLQNALKVRMNAYDLDSIQVLHTLHAMGDTLLEVGRIDGALKVLRDAKRIQNKLPRKTDRHVWSETNFLIAKAFIANGSLELGLKHLRMYIRSPFKRIGGLQPEIAVAFFLTAQIYAKRGEHALAKTSYEKVIKEIEAQLGLDNIDLTLCQELSKIQSIFQNQLLKFSDLTLLYGTVLRCQKQYKDALVCFEISTGLFQSLLPPTSLRISNVEFQKGTLFFETGRYSDAVNALKKSLTLRKEVFPEMSPHIAEVKRLCGLSESQLGNVKSSLQLLRESNFMRKIARQKNKGDIEDGQILFTYGRLHYERGQIGTAMDLYRRSMDLFRSLQSNEANTYILEVTLAVGYAHLKGGGHFKALMSFEQTLYNSVGLRNDIVCSSLACLGDLYIELGRYRDAIVNLEHALRLQREKGGVQHESTAQTLISLGHTYAKLGEFDESKSHYTQAITVLKLCYGDYTDVGKCWLKIADVYLKEKCENHALRCYEQSVVILRSIEACDDYAWSVYQGLGKCLLRLKRHQEAITCLNKALALARKGKDGERIADSQLMTALAQFHTGEEEQALENSEEAINFKLPALDVENAHFVFSAIDMTLIVLSKTAGTYSVEYANALQRKGICLAKLKCFQRAIDIHKQAMNLYKAINGDSHMSVKTSLFNLALCLISLQESTRARQCLYEVHKMIKTGLGDDSIEMIEIQFYIGISYKQEGNLKAAKKCFDDSIQIRRLHSKYECKEAAKTLEMIGCVAAESKEISSIEIAEKYFAESLRLYNFLYCHEDAASLHSKIAHLCVRARTYEKAIVHFEKSLVTSRVLQSSTSSFITEVYLNLGIAHDAINNFSKAIHCYDFCIKDSSDSLTATRALISKGRALSKMERFDDALQCLSDALCKDHTAKKPKIEADILVAKGQVADLMKDNKLALDSYLSALEVYRDLPQSEEDVANTLMEITNSHLRHKRYEEATDYSNEALDIRQNKYGTEHFLTAESIYCKALILFGKNEYEQALLCLELALYNFKKTKSSKLLKSNTLYMIGCAQETLGRIDQAEESLMEATRINEKHPETCRKDAARALRRLGVVLKLKGEYSKSRKHLKKSLLLSVPEFGPHHFEVAQTHEYLAETLYLEGNYEEALQHVQVTLDVYHNTGNSTILGKCYCLKGVILDQADKDPELAIKAYSLSRDYYESSPEVLQNYMGFASTMFKLAILQDHNQFYSSATKNYIKANDLYKIVLKSDETLYSADIFERLANMKGRQKKYEKACVLLERTLKIRVQILGMEHEAVAQALYSLGIIFSKRNEIDAALKALTDCLSIQQLKLGFDAVEIADTLHAIGQCLGNSGDYQNALNLWNDAFEIYRKHGDQNKLNAIKRDIDLGLRLSEEDQND